MSARRTRMTGVARREQLIAVARGIFAERGYAQTSVEEIAHKASVSKPAIYEHFGGKEGLYAVIVDREVRALTAAVRGALEAHTAPRGVLDGAVGALLDYVERCPDGFRILVRDAPPATTSDSSPSLIGDIGREIEQLLTERFVRFRLDRVRAPLYAQMLVGTITQAARWWLGRTKPSKDEVREFVVAFLWDGFRTVWPEG